MTLDPALEVSLWLAPELGNASYLIVERASGAAAVVDPVRDVAAYLAALPPSRPTPLTALETHVHNDFVSGSRELLQRTATEIACGAASPLRFPHRGLVEGEHVTLGAWSFETLATPGHTPEHVAFLLRDSRRRPRALFSGGALMVGGAARTDLLGLELARPLARDLYRTLHERLRDLPEGLAVLPTHGGGSFCASGGGEERTSTMRRERRTNPLLRARGPEEFMARILEQDPYPAYFRRMRELNSGGATLEGEGSRGVHPLELEAFDAWRARGAAIVDTRDPELFDAAHVPGSLAVPVHGPLSAWVGWLVAPTCPVLLVSGDEEEAADATRQLFRIGYDAVQGFLAGGVATWSKAGRPTPALPTLDAPGLRAWLGAGSPGVVLDVRENREWYHGHVPGSLNLPVPTIPQRLAEVPRGVPLLVHCAQGYRAVIAASLLEQSGFGDSVVRIRDGFDAWQRLAPGGGPSRSAAASSSPGVARAPSRRRQ